MRAVRRLLVLAATTVVVLPATGKGQDRRTASASAPAPVTTATTTPPNAILAPGYLAADLAVILSPSMATAMPTQFIVKNVGVAKAEKATLLRVTIKLMPLQGAAVNYKGDPVVTNANFAGLCPKPLQDFEQVIQPLPGGTQQVVGMQLLPLPFGKSGTPKPQSSYIKEVTLVCTFELTATVDTANEPSTAIQGNNTVIRYVQREVRLPLEFGES